MMIRGRSRANPPLILLSGGPGMPETGFFRFFNAALEDVFAVIYWEQQGSGTRRSCSDARRHDRSPQPPASASRHPSAPTGTRAREFGFSLPTHRRALCGDRDDAVIAAAFLRFRIADSEPFL